MSSTDPNPVLEGDTSRPQGPRQRGRRETCGAGGLWGRRGAASSTSKGRQGPQVWAPGAGACSVRSDAESVQQAVSPSFCRVSPLPRILLRPGPTAGAYKTPVPFVSSTAGPPASPGCCLGDLQPAQGRQGPQTSPRALAWPTTQRPPCRKARVRARSQCQLSLS